MSPLKTAAVQYMVALKWDQYSNKELQQFENKLKNHYGISSRIGYLPDNDQIFGYTFAATPKQASFIAKDVHVRIIERDWPVNITDEMKAIDGKSDDYSWALDRINQRTLPLNKNELFKGDGKGATVLLVDSGVNPDAEELGDRVYDPFNLNYDRRGIGTVHADVIGGNNFGVSKNINITDISEFTSNGQTRVSDILWGLNHAVNYAPSKYGVINLSFIADGHSDILDEQIKYIVENYQIPIVVEAGDSSEDACAFSPADSPYAITVSASTFSVLDPNDRPLPKANYGKCVDIYAPGYKVKAIWGKADDSGNRTLAETTGTGVATAIVSSALAQFEQSKDKMYTDILKTQFLNYATQNELLGLNVNSPNRLVYVAASNE